MGCEIDAAAAVADIQETVGARWAVADWRNLFEDEATKLDLRTASAEQSS